MLLVLSDALIRLIPHGVLSDEPALTDADDLSGPLHNRPREDGKFLP
jgi:hypothetical protein